MSVNLLVIGSYKNMKNISNMTLIIPSFCNANCSFCPERWDPQVEVDNEIHKMTWLKSLKDTLNSSINGDRFLVDNITISGGEPTLDPVFLSKVLYSVRSFLDTVKYKVNLGLISNGQFLNGNDADTLQKVFTDTLDHCNISMHSFDMAKNNDIMKVDNTFTFNDVALFFKKLNDDVSPRTISCQINTVVTKASNVDDLLQFVINYITDLNQKQIYEIPFAFAFRTDYRLLKDLSRSNDFIIRPEKDTLAGVHAEFYQKAVELFGEYKHGFCPSCISLIFDDVPVLIKGSCYEPTEVEDPFELVFHMDGNLYYDWSRKKLVK